MTIGVFTDKAIKPTEVQVRSALGPTQGMWLSLLEYVRERHSVQEEFKFCYGKKYGWAHQVRRKGKLLVTLYPNAGHFVVQVILSGTALHDTERLGLHQNALHAIEASTEYSEGRWLFIPVEGGSDLADVKNLLDVKTAARVQA